MTRGRRLAVGVGAVVVALVVAVAVFRPDKLFVDDRVEERLDADVAGALDDTVPADPPPGTAVPGTEAAPLLVGRGTFVAQGGHDLAGGAAVVQRPDGSRVLVLEELDSENGPDLRLYVSPRADGSVDGGLQLAPLKGNVGTQSYDLPAEVDLATTGNVVIWCERFDVPFGTATLT